MRYRGFEHLGLAIVFPIVTAGLVGKMVYDKSSSPALPSALAAGFASGLLASEVVAPAIQDATGWGLQDTPADTLSRIIAGWLGAS